MKDLVRVYLDAVDALSDAIVKNPAGAGYERAVLAQTRQILGKLDKAAESYSAVRVEEFYRAAQGKAAAALGTNGRAAARNAATQVTRLHESAVLTLTQNLYGDLTAAHERVGRGVEDAFRAAQLEAGVQGLATGNVLKVKDLMLAKLAKEGLTAFTDRAGRKWRLDAYAAMAARSIKAEAANRGTMNQLSEHGYDLVQITSHSSPCPLCAPYEGRVYSVSGTAQDYPRLFGNAFGDFANIHPNCGHAVVAYIADLDPNEAETKAFSNRPFDKDPRSEAERRAYEAGQKAKRRASAERRQWERYRVLEPDLAPKTLAAFRAMKRANSPRYRALKAGDRSRAPEQPFDLEAFKLESKRVAATLTQGQKYAVERYTGPEYDFINPPLREGTPFATPFIAETARDLSPALQAMPKYRGVSYRGLAFSKTEYEAFTAGLKKGAAFTDKGFMSTSLSENVARKFEGRRNSVFLRVKGRSGVYVQPLSSVKREDEILFDKGSKWTVTDVQPNGPGALIVDLEEL